MLVDMEDIGVITVRDLRRRYGGTGSGGFDAVRGVTFSVRHGELFALLGTNGAGHLKRALAAGVRGFLPKTVSAEVLADVVRTVHRGGRYVDPELAADAIAAGDSPLTSREADVLELAADGAPVGEIARRAALTSGTVRNYLSSAAAKLGAANRHEAVQVARANGWI
jgi:two-component system, NarL family, response regulator DesR